MPEFVDPFEQKNPVQNFIDPFEKQSENLIQNQKVLPKIPGSQDNFIDPFEEKNQSFFGRNFPLITGQLEQVWKDPNTGELVPYKGMTDEDKQSLRLIFGDPNTTILGKFNERLIDGGYKLVNRINNEATSLALVATGLAGDGINLINKAINGDLAGNVGLSVTRDLNVFLMSKLGESGNFSMVKGKSDVIKSEKTGKEINNIIEYAKESPENKTEVLNNVNNIVDKEINDIRANSDVVIGETFRPDTIDKIQKRTQVLDEIVNGNKKVSESIPEIKIEIPQEPTAKPIITNEIPIVETPTTTTPIVTAPKIESTSSPIVQLNRTPSLPIETTKKIIESSKKFFADENIVLDPKKPISLQIQELWQSGKYDVPSIIRRIAEDNKITAEEFTNFIYPSVKESAKELNAYSQLAKYYKNQLDPAASFDTGAGIYGTLKRLDNIRRGLMVTRLSTAVRNYISQGTRIGLDALQSGLDYVLQSAIKPFVDPIQFQKNRVSPISNLKALVDNITQWNPKKFKEIKNLTNQILDNFPKEKTRLFLNYVSDIKNSNVKVSKDFLGKIEGAVDIINAPNKVQEYITRRAVFLARLNESILANPKFYKNKTLEMLIKDNELNLLRTSDIAVAIDKALDATFSKDFSTGKGGYDAFANRLIKLVNSAPFLLTNIIPYPRFLMNAIKYQYEYSPFGVLSFLSKEERLQIAKGDTSKLSAAMLGSGMLMAGYLLRQQPYAGEKWYEFKLGDKMVDVRPFNPFAGYLFMGDVIKRYQEGTLKNLDTKGIASVLFGIRGTNATYLTDALINYFTDPKLDKDTMLAGLKRLTGETLATFLTPFQNLTDIYAQFFPEARTAKDTTGQEFTGALERRFPMSNLPVLTSPTSYIIDQNGNKRAAPITRQDPLLTQVTGMAFTAPKNPAEKELDRLGFTSREIFHPSGIPELDRAYKDKFSVAVGYGISNMVESEQYKSLNNTFQTLILKKTLEAAKESVRKELQKDTSLAPFLVQTKINSLDKETRKVVDQLVGIDYIDTLVKELKNKTK